MDRLDNGVRRCREETVDVVRPRHPKRHDTAPRVVIAVRTVVRQPHGLLDEELADARPQRPRTEAQERELGPGGVGEQRPFEQREGDSPGTFPVVVQLSRAGDQQQVRAAQVAIGAHEEAELRRHTQHDAANAPRRTDERANQWHALQ